MVSRTTARHGNRFMALSFSNARFSIQLRTQPPSTQAEVQGESPPSASREPDSYCAALVQVIPIPTLGARGLMALGALLALVAVWRMKRRVI